MQDIFSRFEHLTQMLPDEVVTHSYTADVQLASGATLALITLDNGLDHTRPATLGPASMIELGRAVQAQVARAAAGEIAAIGVTGHEYVLAAGADPQQVPANGKSAVQRARGRSDEAALLAILQPK